MQALQQLDALRKQEDLQSWKSTSIKPSVVMWNFTNVLNIRRWGVVREGVVEKGLSRSWRKSVCPSPNRANREVQVTIGKSLRRRRRRRRQWRARGERRRR